MDYPSILLSSPLGIHVRDGRMLQAQINCNDFLVPDARLELARQSHQNLNLARLPIPPIGHMELYAGIEPTTC